MSIVADNLERVKTAIAEAAERSGRGPDSVLLVAVSKTKPAELVREAVDAGHFDFGENYAQELRDKAAAVDDERVRWHFIGHLQKNKVKYLAGLAHDIQSVDRVELAREIEKRSGKAGTVMRAFLEVNLGEEETKSGARVDEVMDVVREVRSMEHIKLIGLMTMPPFFDDPEGVRPYYRRLRELRDELRDKTGEPDFLPELSMGLSGDYEVAIEEGATMVRVGTAIFGERETGHQR
ncbi:MAG: YggS family pyridoxal phosphate-dependent enzyme [bacterium]